MLPHGRLDELVLTHPQLGVNLLRGMATRLRETTHSSAPPAVETTGA